MTPSCYPLLISPLDLIALSLFVSALIEWRRG